MGPTRVDPLQGIRVAHDDSTHAARSHGDRENVIAPARTLVTRLALFVGVQGGEEVRRGAKLLLHPLPRGRKARVFSMTRVEQARPNAVPNVRNVPSSRWVEER